MTENLNFLINTKQSQLISQDTYPQAIALVFTLDMYGTGNSKDKQNIIELVETLEEIAESSGLGEFDGEGFGIGDAELYFSTSNADELFELIRPTLRDFNVKPIKARLIYNDIDESNVQEKEVFIS